MPALAAKIRVVARSGLGALPFSLATATLLLFQIGYSFETGDQLQYLLLPYREIFPNFLPGDWFTWQTSHYHLSFAWIVRALDALAGHPGLPRAMFALHCATLAAFGYAIWRLARAFGLGLFESSFCVLMFGVVRQIGLAGALIDHAGLVPADLALAPFLLACAAFCERRLLALGAWLGLSGLMHANYAVLGPLCLFPLEALRVRDWRNWRAWRSPLMAAVAFALIAAPTLVLLVGTFLAKDSDPAAVAVTLFVRSPHHYDLFAMRPDEFEFGALLVLLAAPYWWRQLRARSLPLQLMAAMAAVLSIGLLGSGLHIVSLSRLFAWRMSIPLFALLLLGVGDTLHRAIAEHAVVRLVWLSAGIAAMISFAQSDPLQASPWNTNTRLAISLLFAFAGATYAQLRTPHRPSLEPVRTTFSLLGSAIAVAIAIHVVSTPTWDGRRTVRWSGLHWLEGRIELDPPAHRLFALVRARTPEDARFLIPPGLQLFRMQARRAIFVDWKCAPMKGDEALEWQRRMLLAIGTPTFPARGYDLPRAADALYFARPIDELRVLAKHEGLTHLLVRSSNLRG
ncbi:MAG TPA: DUF6798 domain-containing protein, partial [Polyangiales bacterium]|nr:DUF6798 domain-containing protein [Polyangiales bacterium]